MPGGEQSKGPMGVRNKAHKEEPKGDYKGSRSDAQELGPSRTRVEIRYAETDGMRRVYHSHFLIYFEVARTGALAELGHPYSELEAQGLFIPVLAAHCDYLKPARYGDSLIVKTWRYRRGARLGFRYQVLRESDDLLLVTGWTEHACMDLKGKALRPPAYLLKYFE
jgi:acyl-CoA thioester hydrolase